MGVKPDLKWTRMWTIVERDLHMVKSLNYTSHNISAHMNIKPSSSSLPPGVS